MKMGARLKCATCGSFPEISRKLPWCACGAVLELDFIPDTLKIDVDQAGWWRYQGILPVQSRISLGEVVTPIVSMDFGGRSVDAKLEYVLPTGSFKDRGAAILAGAMKDAGIPRCMEDSSGNAAAALSAYCARAGIDCEIYCPASTSPMKLLQVERAGAVIHRIEGPRPNTTAALRSKLGEVFYASHNWHPLFLHGTKTMAYEIAEQYRWDLPHHIVAPTGGGAVLLGLRLGFTELMQMRQVERLPKLHAVQAEACAPLLHEVVKPGQSLAEGILTPSPPRLTMLKAAVDSVAVVSEDEIRNGFRELCRAGFNAEPTSAVVVRGVPKLRIPERESVLVILTGSGMKSDARSE
jgi:threonine synthase